MNMTAEEQKEKIAKKEQELKDAEDLVEQLEDEIETLWQEDIEE